MGIDVCVHSLHDEWVGLSPQHLRACVSWVDRLVTHRDEFDLAAWRQLEATLPSVDDLPDPPMLGSGVPAAAPVFRFLRSLVAFGTHGPMPPSDAVRRATAAEIAAAVRELQDRLAERLGKRVAWKDSASANAEDDDRYLGELAPTGLLRARSLAAHMGRSGELSPGIVAEVIACDPLLAPIPTASPSALPQLSAIDIQSMLLPVEFDEILFGRPYDIGSGPRLARELARLEATIRAADPGALERMADVWSVLDLLQSAVELSAERGLPVFITG